MIFFFTRDKITLPQIIAGTLKVGEFSSVETRGFSSGWNPKNGWRFGSDDFSFSKR